jgi:Ubiquitin-conjugating enzyme
MEFSSEYPRALPHIRFTVQVYHPCVGIDGNAFFDTTDIEYDDNGKIPLGKAPMHMCLSLLLKLFYNECCLGDESNAARKEIAIEFNKNTTLFKEQVKACMMESLLKISELNIPFFEKSKKELNINQSKFTTEVFDKKMLIPYEPEVCKKIESISKEKDIRTAVCSLAKWISNKYIQNV